MTRIEEIRRAWGMSQIDFAAAAAVSQGTVSRWENGDLEPSRSALRCLRAFAMGQRKLWHDEWLVEPLTKLDRNEARKLKRKRDARRRRRIAA